MSKGPGSDFSAHGGGFAAYVNAFSAHVYGFFGSLNDFSAYVHGFAVHVYGFSAYVNGSAAHVYNFSGYVDGLAAYVYDFVAAGGIFGHMVRAARECVSKYLIKHICFLHLSINFVKLNICFFDNLFVFILSSQRNCVPG